MTLANGRVSDWTVDSGEISVSLAPSQEKYGGGLTRGAVLDANPRHAGLGIVHQVAALLANTADITGITAQEAGGDGVAVLGAGRHPHQVGHEVGQHEACASHG